MKGKPLYPFAAIAVVGLILMVTLSFMGVHQKEERLALEGEDAVEQQPPQDTGDTADPMALAEQVYQRSCIGCHGGDFDGGYSLLGLSDRYTKEEVISIILEGVQTDAGMMPGGLANAEEADALAEYLLEVTN